MMALKQIASAFLILMSVVATDAAAAKSVEVADGVYVTKTTFASPANEQPFFGFATKSPMQIGADKALLSRIKDLGFSKEKAFRRAVYLGWKAVGRKNLAEAGRRFNQAHLFQPGHSDVFHGFAVVVHLRFGNAEFAEELFLTGSRLKGRNPGYMADYGRFLLTVGKPAEALTVLDEAVRDQPSNATAWSNLAWAKLRTGRPKEACEAAFRSARLSPSRKVAGDLKLLGQEAGCSR